MELIFTVPTKDGFFVSYHCSNLQTNKDVYDFIDPGGVARFLSRLAEFDRPWTGAETWQSIESDFSLSANCSPLGIVTFIVEISSFVGAPEEWRLVASVTTELGQLRAIASGAVRFFRNGA